VSFSIQEFFVLLTRCFRLEEVSVVVSFCRGCDDRSYDCLGPVGVISLGCRVL
jgi:hypothetical protein